MCNEAHMVCIDSSERGKAVSNNGEESDKDVVDNIDKVIFPATDIDPAYFCQ